MTLVPVHLFLQLTPRILDAYQNVAQLSLADAILRYLQIWQALPDFGISYMVVRSEFVICKGFTMFHMPAQLFDTAGQLENRVRFIIRYKLQRISAAPFSGKWEEMTGVDLFDRFKGSRKDEVLGIAPNRLIRIDLSVGDVVKTWRYNNMKQWNVNWDIQQVTPTVRYLKVFWSALI